MPSRRHPVPPLRLGVRGAIRRGRVRHGGRAVSPLRPSDRVARARGDIEIAPEHAVAAGRRRAIELTIQKSAVAASQIAVETSIIE